jgi:hypothetical protein
VTGALNGDTRAVVTPRSDEYGQDGVTPYAPMVGSLQMTITPAHYSKTQRRLLTTLGGVGVAALAAGTFVLSYADLRLLALRGGAARHWAFLYPGMLDGLVVVIILAIVTARRSGWFSRAVRWLLLVVLVAGAGAAGVQRAVKGYEPLPDTWVNTGVAVAPWAILILAVWLWIAMIKHLRSLRTRAARSGDPDGRAKPVESGPEPVPATVIEQSIIPGLGDAENRPRARPVRELEPVRAAARAEPPQPQDPEPNPWDAARIDRPEPWEDDTEPTEPVPAPVSGREAETTPSDTALSDPVPASWREQGPEADAAPAEPSDPVPTSWGRLPESSFADVADEDEPEPLLPPAPRREDLLPRLTEPATAADPTEPEPEPKVETPMNDKPSGPVEDEPPPRFVARTSLPTDVRLVGGPKRPSLTDTQPDGIRLPDTNPDGIPVVNTAEDDEDDAYVDERAEDPDAGTEAGPPSSTFRSSPTPPRG